MQDQSFQTLSKVDQLLALKTFRENEVFRYLLSLLEAEAEPFRKEVFDAVISSLGDLVMREQAIGRIPGLFRIAKLLDQIIEELENEVQQPERQNEDSV